MKTYIVTCDECDVVVGEADSIMQMQFCPRCMRRNVLAFRPRPVLHFWRGIPYEQDSLFDVNAEIYEGPPPSL